MDFSFIKFPGWGIHLSNVPQSFKVFGFEIALYGVCITCGVLLAFLLCLKLAKEDGQNHEHYWDLAIWIMVLGILGARVYYVIFSWDYYSKYPNEILDIRGGGLAIYGGVITGFAVMAVYSKIRKMNFFRIADVIVAGALVGQIVGRFGNFFNRECFGEYTSGLFRMVLPVGAVREGEITEKMLAHTEVIDGVSTISVAPTFLYEAAWNLCLLLLYMILRKRKHFAGEMALFYLGGYGLGRFFVEGLRTDQLRFAGTTIAVSQMLGITLFFAAIVTEVIVLTRMAKKKSFTVLSMTTICTDVFEDSGEMHAGGEALNFAATACEYDFMQVSLMGAIGDDPYGEFCMEAIQDKPINTDHVHVLSEYPTANHIISLTEKGDRYFKEGSWTAGAYGEFLLNEADRKAIVGSDYVFLNYHSRCFEEVVELRKKADFVLMVDFNEIDEASFADIEKYAPFIDQFMISGTEALAPKFKELSRKWKGILNITLAENGSVSYRWGKEYRVKAVPVEKVVDTTGCGDSYHAGFLCSYAQTKNIIKAMEEGSRTASITLGHEGAF